MAERMEWEKLLSTETMAKTERSDAEKTLDSNMDKYPSGNFVNDYERIISSPAFRRLQDKTQVFPLDKEDFVRTRLTHSLEVAAIANRLGVMVTHGKEEEQKEDGQEGKRKNARLPIDFHASGKSKEDAEKIQERIDNIPMVLACAGLIHDMGNPPFGHFGEEVIREWFRELPNKEKNKMFDYKGKSITKWLSPEQLTDLKYFDGNAQGIRILSKAYYKPEGNELNLTYSVFNTLIKYPVTAENITNPPTWAKNRQINKNKIKKFGYFQAEKEIAEEICTTTGTMVKDEETDEITDFRRHPLTYLMEAADDIVYQTDDLEDGVQKGLVTVDQIISYFEDLIAEKRNKIDSSIEDANFKTNPNTKLDYTKKMIDVLGDKREELKNIYGPGRETDLLAFQQWCAYLKEWLMYCVAYTFTLSDVSDSQDNSKEDDNNEADSEQIGYEEIMNGSYYKDKDEEGNPYVDKNENPYNKDIDLFELSFHKYTIDFLEKVTHKYVHNDAEIEKLELSSKTILNFLLDNFIQAALYWDEDKDKMTAADKRLMDILSEELKEDYLRICSAEEDKRVHLEDEDGKYLGPINRPDEGERLYRRILMVIDFISGMTDSYARNLYRELNGIGEL